MILAARIVVRALPAASPSTRRQGRSKRAVTTSGEAIKHVEGRKVVFTAASVAAEPIVILVDLEETFTTSTGSSGHQKSPDERSLTMCRRIHMEMPVGEVCFQELKNVPRDKVLDHLEQLL